jgi:predicted nucleic acid-binding protein
MTTVVDSNVIASLVLPASYSAQAKGIMKQWDDTEEHLIAPTLFEYELATIIRRSVVTGQLEPGQASTILARLLNSRVNTISPSVALHRDALRLAERIGQSKAYDAHYLALATREDAPLWTADKRLANAAQAIGLTWVHWIGDWSPGENQ